MSDFKLTSNVEYSTYDVALTYEGVGRVHNNALYNCFQLLNKIGDDRSIQRLSEIAIEETKQGVSAGIYPDEAIAEIEKLYNIFASNEENIDELIVNLQSFYNEIITNKNLNETAFVGCANLALQSTIFWNNFSKDNEDFLRKAGRTAYIAASDLLGGLGAAWQGGKVGLKAGTIFGNPGAGLAIGAIGGFLLGGAVASGTAYYASR